MTKEKAIDLLDNLLGMVEDNQGSDYDAALKMGIKALKQESCEDAISRKAVLDIVKFEDKWLADAKAKNANTDIAFGGLRGKISKLPSVTPTQKTGRWIFTDQTHEHARCSECGYGNVDLVDGKPHHYCPNCGSKNGMED